jgi:4a-hydroxytetrahydrobiopterin dehydratase
MGLAAEKCMPCKGEEAKIDSKQVLEMLKDLKGWQTQEMERRLFKDFKFKNFVEALAFVKKVGEIAEAEQHHPDISFGWGYAEIVLTTHDADGLSRNDFIVAAKIDGLGQSA